MRIKKLLLAFGIFFIIWHFSLSNIFASQIEKTIEYRFGEKEVSKYGGRFTAQITFDPLPKLLETSTVHVKIMAMCDLDFDPEYRIFTVYNNLIDFTQLMPATWTPPIKEGDLYEGTFTITPTEIGPFSIVIIPRAPQLKLKHRFEFFLTIDESGKLVHLFRGVDSKHAGMVIHPPVAGNEIELKYHLRQNFDGYISDDFINIFNISPLPALNETCTVRFELTANRECPEGAQFHFSWTENMEVFDLPNSWIGEVNIGDVHIDSFRIVPKSTGCGRFNLWVRAHSTPEGIDLAKRSSARPDQATETYHVTLFIDESGKLTFIGRSPAKYIQKDCSEQRSKKYVSQPKVFIESKLKKKKTEK
ncbi:MAG: hypothetical protein WBD28_05235 [Candidatus Zixiibacteriota bacterium]